MKNHREFRILFNTDSTNRRNSYWNITDRCRLTITYLIPRDAKLFLEHEVGDGIYSETDLTMGEFLEKGYTLTNEVYGSYNGDSKLKGSREYTIPPKTGDVEKTARILPEKAEDGSTIIEYRVDFNGFSADKAGDHNEFGIDPATFWLEDDFDSRLEYVEGSLQIEVYAPDSMRHRYTFQYDGEPGFQEDAPEKGRTTLTAEAAKFSNCTHVGNAEWDTKTNLLDYMRESKKDGTTEVTPRDALYRFVYRMKLKDEASVREALELHNKATVHYNDKFDRDDADVTFEPTLLEKTGKLKEGETGARAMMEYTIDINPFGADLAQTTVPETGLTVNNPNFTLTDKMDPILELDISSVKVYRVEADNTWTLLTAVSKQDEVTAEGNNYVFRPGDDNTFEMVLPDEQHLIIAYDAFLNVPSGSMGNVTNTVSLSGGLKLEDQNQANYEVNKGNVEVSGDASLRLYKKDASTGDYIDGAVLTLYTLTGDEKTPASIVIDEHLSGLKEYKALRPSAISGAETGPDSGYSGYYVLVETEAPGGYQMNNKPVVLMFGEPPAEGPAEVTVTYNGETYELEVQYIHVGDNVVVFDDEPNAYSLPESGGEGFGPLYAVGIAMMTLSAVLLLERRQRRRESEGF